MSIKEESRDQPLEWNDLGLELIHMEADLTNLALVEFRPVPQKPCG